MHKLLPRTPSAPLLPPPITTSFLSMPFPYKPHSSSSVALGVSLTKALAQRSSPFSSLSMPPASLLPAGGYSSLSACVSRKPSVRPSFYASSCRCSSDIKITGAPFRAWVLARPAWFCTVAGTHGSVAAAAAVTDGGSKDYDGEGKDEKEEKGVKLNRRQRGSSEVLGNADLLTIPGVGPKNLRKLVEKGFRGMAELKQLYKDKFRGKSNEKMVEYLRSSVGIIHKNHAESITVFIKETVDEELKDTTTDVKSSQKDRITFCVEGNISVGKTTFLQRIVSDTIELRDLVEVVPEPIDKWQNIGPEHFNILDAFYAEPHRYAYTFQNYVFVTRVMQERESSAGVKPLRLMERSVFSDRMVFVRAVHEAKWMNEMEINIYDSWFDPVVSVLPGLIPDGFIYLRATPDTCHKRMQLRRRAEEGGVSIDYLRGLHEKHESWLFPSQSGGSGVLALSKPPLQLDNSLHPEIRDRVFYLEGDHMHSSIQKVPALILDCEANIDFSRDIEAKEHYARQVSEFFKYVKTRKEVSPAKSGPSILGNQQIMLPREGGLFFPNDSFPGSALQSLQLKRAMSMMSGP